MQRLRKAAAAPAATSFRRRHLKVLNPLLSVVWVEGSCLFDRWPLLECWIRRIGCLNLTAMDFNAAAEKINSHAFRPQSVVNAADKEDPALGGIPER